MTQRLCVNCGTATVPVNAWHAVCPACNLYASTLDADSGTGVEGLEDLRRANFEVLLDRFEQIRSPGGLRALEIGCSQGFFMEAALARGMDIQGIEPELAMADKARAKGLSVTDGFFPDALPAGETFDMIIFNDVFEHLPDPEAALAACQRHLKPDGSLVINLPSSNGTLFRVSKLLVRLGWAGPYERLWQKGFPSPHTFYFNERNLKALVERVTALRQVDAHRLASLHSTGTRARVRATYKGLTGEIITVGVWCLSLVLPALPSDICVLHFRNTAA